MVSAVPTRLRLALSLVAVVALTGCTDLDPASAAGINHDDLVSATAAQLSRAAGLTYTAHYHLAGGGTAAITQTQNPARTAYDYPGGRIVKTPTSSPAGSPPSTALVTPEAVLTLLNQAALDPEVVAEARDTTIAGRHANCLSVSRVATPFAVCVTNEGVLASFTATLDGKQVEQTLTDYTVSR